MAQETTPSSSARRSSSKELKSSISNYLYYTHKALDGLSKQDYETAILFFHQARQTTLDPEQTGMAQIGVAICLAYQGKHQFAQQEYEQAKKILRVKNEPPLRIHSISSKNPESVADVDRQEQFNQMLDKELALDADSTTRVPDIDKENQPLLSTLASLASELRPNFFVQLKYTELTGSPITVLEKPLRHWLKTRFPQDEYEHTYERLAKEKSVSAPVNKKSKEEKSEAPAPSKQSVSTSFTSEITQIKQLIKERDQCKKITASPTDAAEATEKLLGIEEQIKTLCRKIINHPVQTAAGFATKAWALKISGARGEIQSLFFKQAVEKNKEEATDTIQELLGKKKSATAPSPQTFSFRT